jgi:hypothetical protein
MGFKLTFLVLMAVVIGSQAGCPPSKDELKPVVATLEAEFEKIKRESFFDKAV